MPDSPRKPKISLRVAAHMLDPELFSTARNGVKWIKLILIPFFTGTNVNGEQWMVKQQLSADKRKSTPTPTIGSAGEWAPSDDQ